ncbi:Aldo/keto reductase/potassium channel subunit beta [Trema orientale]|uniref:Aldo/keto reductase/potassium channel subunit beta n=1 Tax=Trema orientale TaxID=63057 RepID=A0A2P5FWC5_TREOI|nr:Aldo/keto reductase/potassium channel subunit beta [Trema orientale]
MIGKALKQLPREKNQSATKFGITPSEDFKFGGEGVRECCEASLKGLDFECTDFMGELKKLIEEGKIKDIGLSEANIDTMRRADHRVHPVTALQMEGSLWTREIEDEIIPLCRFVLVL